MNSFSSKVFIIGVNPYVLLSVKILRAVFERAGKTKGTIPVTGTVNGYHYQQTLVKYSGKWRLYLNGPMLKGAKAGVGDTVELTVGYDTAERIVAMHPQLEKALKQNKKALTVFNSLPPSRQKEIKRYIANLKTEEAVTKNIERAINFLLGNERFIGRDKP